MKKNNYDRKELVLMLRESNAIENEYSLQSLNDSLSAWEYAYSHRKKNWTVKMILNVHALLMRTLDPDIAGKIRDCDVWIGGERKFFVSQALIADELRQWIKKWWNVKTEEEIREAHIAVEERHPFRDGNGRVFRLLMNIQRINTGLPLLIIHTGEEQSRYYLWFSNNDNIEFHKTKLDNS